MNENEHRVVCLQIAERAFRRHLAEHPMRHYASILTLHGAVRLTQVSGSETHRSLVNEQLQPFWNGEVDYVLGAYDRMYQCGGNATAWMAMEDPTAERIAWLARHAEDLAATHPRDAAGVFAKGPKQPEAIWIDTAFAVCPFLLWAGLLAERPEWVDESVKQMWGMKEVLFDEEWSLYHQARGFTAPGRLSEDHWGRGNGWAAIALCELAADLPDSHPMASALREHFKDFMTACVRVQDEQGLWHQEMTRPDSYAETSGTGLLLYAIGRGLEKGILSDSFREPFERGLRGLLGYITHDGSVFHCCRGCLNPGDGSIEAYMAREWVRNDQHAFGPVVLAFSQAVRLGIRDVSIEFDMAPPPED